MKSKKNVLFVCTGNVFRSVTAAYSLRKYLRENKIHGFEISSAGTHAQKDDESVTVRSALRSLGISVRHHIPRRLTRKMLDDYDLVVCMARNHQHCIKEMFGFSESVLFNSIALGRRTSIFDANEVVPNFMESEMARERWRAYVRKTVREIHRLTPRFYRGLKKRFEIG